MSYKWGIRKSSQVCWAGCNLQPYGSREYHDWISQKVEDYPHLLHRGQTDRRAKKQVGTSIKEANGSSIQILNPLRVRYLRNRGGMFISIERHASVLNTLKHYSFVYQEAEHLSHYEMKRNDGFYTVVN